MSIDGYAEYKRREFCKDINCHIQARLEEQKPDTSEYENIRLICKNKCVHTTYEFHHWLINNGYLVVKPEIKK